MVKKLEIVLIFIFIIIICMNVNYAKNIDNPGLTNDSETSQKILDGNNNSSFLKTVTIKKTSNTTNNAVKIDSKVKTSSTTNIDVKIDSKTKTISSLSSQSKETPKKLSQKDIISASKAVNSYVSKNGKLPDFVKIKGEKFSMAEFLYLMSKTIVYKYKNSDSEIPIKYSVKYPARPMGDNLKARLSLKDCYNTAQGVINYINSMKIAPNGMYIENHEVYFGFIQYQTIIYSFAKLLSQKDINTEITINVKKTSKINRYMPTYTRPGTYKNLNSKYSGESIKDYLNPTKNCQVKNDAIKLLSKEITKGCKTKLQKAIAIHNWVAANIAYDGYFNTKSGAVKTMSKRSGNCVDQTHLAIALYRTSGIPARYVHGTCKFVSGNTVGHVWSQVLIAKTWLVSDTTSYELNSLGTVNYWDSATYKLQGKYSSLPF